MHIVSRHAKASQRPWCTIHLTYNVHVVHIAAMTQTKLDLWMGDNRDDQWLAQVLGCSRSQASRVRRGKSRPSPSGAFQIERVTRGKVKASELLAEPIAANDADTPPQEAAA